MPIVSETRDFDRPKQNRATPRLLLPASAALWAGNKASGQLVAALAAGPVVSILQWHRRPLAIRPCLPLAALGTAIGAELERVAKRFAAAAALAGRWGHRRARCETALDAKEKALAAPFTAAGIAASPVVSHCWRRHTFGLDATARVATGGTESKRPRHRAVAIIFAVSHAACDTSPVISGVFLAVLRRWRCRRKWRRRDRGWRWFGSCWFGSCWFGNLHLLKLPNSLMCSRSFIIFFFVRRAKPRLCGYCSGVASSTSATTRPLGAGALCEFHQVHGCHQRGVASGK